MPWGRGSGVRGGGNVAGFSLKVNSESAGGIYSTWYRQGNEGAQKTILAELINKLIN